MLLNQSELPKARATRILFLVFIIGWMSFYPIYTSFYKAYAIEQYERHLAHMAGNSMFFNPWQYRILCPMLVEWIYQILDHTIFTFFDFSMHLPLQGGTAGKNEVTQKLYAYMQNPEFVKYNIVFIGFRLVENLFVFWLVYQYLIVFVKNRPLVILGIMLLALFMGNSVVDSDYTFNTYMDIIVYLLAALVIVKSYNIWWIVPITIIGALNRETSILIPALAFCAKADWRKWPKVMSILFENQRMLSVTVISYVLFVSIFVSVRVYYGMQPVSTWRVPAGLPMIKLNLLSASAMKTYMEMFGVFGFLPFWSILLIKRMDYHLRVFFWVIVPVWFLIHIATAIGFQSRLYLVPTILVFIPSVLAYIQATFVSNHKMEVAAELEQTELM